MYIVLLVFLFITFLSCLYFLGKDTKLKVYFKYTYCCMIMIGFGSCGKFNLSPYIEDVKDEQRNQVAIEKIRSNEARYTKGYKVAVISDSHNYFNELAAQVKYINSIDDELAFVVHTGDATNLGLLVEWDMFHSEIKKLTVPFFLVIGNHDLLSNGENIYRKRYSNTFNKSMLFKGTQFVFFNNNNWESSGAVPDIDWLKESLSQNIGARKIVFSHVQPDDPDRFDSNLIQKTKKIVDNAQVDLYISGHNHNPGVGDFSNATRITAGASSKGKILILTFDSANNLSYDFYQFN